VEVGADKSVDEARRFLEDAEFIWYQNFELVPGVQTPGVNDIGRLFEACKIPADLSGHSVLDIGTANGGIAFTAERRGANRVLAVDIYPEHWFGVDRLRDFLGSRVEHRQLSVYNLLGTVDERFDVVFFCGVLYHLRHPLLALDNVRGVLNDDGLVLIETAVADHELGGSASRPLVRFYRGSELGDDPSCWFAPSISALVDWCRSSGLEPEVQAALASLSPKLWSPRRCVLRATRTPGAPEFMENSYDTILRGVPADPAAGDGFPST
jgi:tRNA (mo5U34)-methyltransferase